eukprot:Platyproteum_vivax@DN4487_c0_g1_i1.p1
MALSFVIFLLFVCLSDGKLPQEEYGEVNEFNGRCSGIWGVHFKNAEALAGVVNANGRYLIPPPKNFFQYPNDPKPRLYSEGIKAGHLYRKMHYKFVKPIKKSWAKYKDEQALDKLLNEYGRVPFIHQSFLQTSKRNIQKERCCFEPVTINPQFCDNRAVLVTTLEDTTVGISLAMFFKSELAFITDALSQCGYKVHYGYPDVGTEITTTFVDGIPIKNERTAAIKIHLTEANLGKEFSSDVIYYSVTPADLIKEVVGQKRRKDKTFKLVIWKIQKEEETPKKKKKGASFLEMGSKAITEQPPEQQGAEQDIEELKLPVQRVISPEERNEMKNTKLNDSDLLTGKLSKYQRPRSSTRVDQLIQQPERPADLSKSAPLSKAPQPIQSAKSPRPPVPKRDRYIGFDKERIDTRPRTPVQKFRNDDEDTVDSAPISVRSPRIPRHKDKGPPKPHDAFYGKWQQNPEEDVQEEPRMPRLPRPKKGAKDPGPPQARRGNFGGALQIVDNEGDYDAVAPYDEHVKPDTAQRPKTKHAFEGEFPAGTEENKKQKKEKKQREDKDKRPDSRKAFYGKFDQDPDIKSPREPKGKKEKARSREG